MDLYAFFHRKDEKIRSQHCVVEKVVELSESEYARFYQSPLAEYDFISKHRGAMRQDADGTRHCLLVLGENQEDGILVDAEGYDYARYHAFSSQGPPALSPGSVPYNSKIQSGDGGNGGAIHTKSHHRPAERNVPDTDR